MLKVKKTPCIYTLKTHIETVHKKQKKFECHICNKCFSQAGYRCIHIKTVHQKVKLFKCDLCKKKFGQKGNLNQHKIAVHEKLRSDSWD